MARNPMPHEQEIESHILDGMARAIWVHAYMIWATEVDPPPVLHGDTWEEIAPDNKGTRTASMEAAKELAGLIAKANSLYGAYPLEDVFDTVEGRMGRGGTQADRARAFGEEVALLAIGGRDRQDGVLRHRPDLVIPDFKVTLNDDGDAISWDGGFSWEREHGPSPMDNPSQWPGSEIQSLLFDRQRYSLSQARRWAQDHGLKYGSLDTTDNYHRLRQFDPGNRRCRTIELGHDIKAVVCETRNPGESGTRWAVLVNGDRQWEAGNDAQEALSAARRRYGGGVSLETGPDGEPVRTGDCPSHGRTTRAKRAPSRPAAPPSPPDPMALTEFAQAVHRSMPAIQQEPGPSGRDRGRFGPDKVFIAAIWRQLERDPRFRGTTLEQFKRSLLDANRNRYLNLARADMVGAMDPTEVMQSEILDRGASFHFVLDPSDARHRRNPAMDIRQFAGIVNAELPYVVPEEGVTGRARGRFGRKVFIGGLWRQIRTHPQFEGMTLQQFKRRLFEAHKQQLLVLARADLVAAMDPEEVAESEYDAGGATFHFVVDE
jgi:hypothetical protein